MSDVNWDDVEKAEQAAQQRPTVDIPISKCRICSYPRDAATLMGGSGKVTPEPGDMDICLNCGALSVFGLNMTSRAPYGFERDSLPDEALTIIAGIKKRGRFYAQ